MSSGEWRGFRISRASACSLSNRVTELSTAVYPRADLARLLEGLRPPGAPPSASMFARVPRMEEVLREDLAAAGGRDKRGDTQGGAQNDGERVAA